MTHAQYVLEQEIERLTFLIKNRKAWLRVEDENHPHRQSVRNGIFSDEMKVQDLEAALNIMKGAR
ncbi:hypothetical protein NIGALANA_226 [Bacillus phage Nigalana]|uniref:Uncharacterized protein n=2 Tax=Wphvirus megatron TaxID=1987728 RepID=A0A024B2F0_9CAUD|nr:hypothetical protein FP75_gp217 [Bacillus phage Megatron]YP_009282618.1 hypothetical protein BI005_gp226 [Bacillus phage Nigalana]ANI24837.1 hypothetical protein SMUDGE_218 [Bacillus phage Smudge]ASR79137.1 hypothetical protein ZAINNY_228 [Bacillus phage Zainny]AHZ10799.1 hypothetical protein [Bacillus phage Megatron]AMW61374.1 hypothetical protein NIGALANA_226 [Bacillus phage Nigalana]